jgi:hypothetical protein
MYGRLLNCKRFLIWRRDGFAVMYPAFRCGTMTAGPSVVAGDNARSLFEGKRPFVTHLFFGL